MTTTMHLLEYNPAAKTIIEIPADSCDLDPRCHYIWTEGKRVEIPFLGPDDIDYLVWQHPDWEPPTIAARLAMPDSTNVADSDAFKTLCAYARNYIEEYADKTDVDELERIIGSLSQRPAIADTAAEAGKTPPAEPTAITTVAELVKLLQSQPQDMRVVVNGYEGGYSDVKPLIQIPISLNVHPDDRWYYGNHDDPRGGMPVETVLLISRYGQ